MSSVITRSSTNAAIRRAALLAVPTLRHPFALQLGGFRLWFGQVMAQIRKTCASTDGGECSTSSIGSASVSVEDESTRVATWDMTRF